MRALLLLATAVVVTICSGFVLSEQANDPQDTKKEARFSERIARFVRNGLADPQAYIVELFQWKEVPETSNFDDYDDNENLGCRTALKLLQSESSDWSNSEDTFARGILDTMKYTLQSLKGSVDEKEEKSCKQLATTDQMDECEKITNSLKDEALEYLHAGLSEAEVCKKLAGATVATDYTGAKYGYPGSNVNEEEKLFALGEQVTAIVDGTHTVAGSEVPNSQRGPYGCKMCLTLVHLVDVAVAQDFEKVQEAREIIGDLCDSMSEQSTCHQFLARFDQIVSWIKNGSNPKSVCARVSMCQASDREDEERDQQFLISALLPAFGFDSSELVTSEEFADDHACVYCTAITTIIQYVDKYQKDSLHTVKTVLKYACKLVPKNCKCDEMEHHFDEIVKLIEEGKEPRDACKSIGICKDSDYFPKELASNKPSSQTIPFLLNELEAFFNLDRCIYCDSITTLLQIIVDEEPDQVDHIRTYADMICEILGKDNECHTYVAQLDTVIDELKSGKHPREICVDLKYCTRHSTSTPMPMQERIPSSVDSLPSALDQHPSDLCFGLVKFLEYAWRREPRNVLKGLENTKSICVESGDNKCPVILDQMEKMTNLLESNESAENICGQFEICNSASSSSESYGSSPESCIPCPLLLQTVDFMVKNKPEFNSNVATSADTLCVAHDPSEMCRARMKPFETAGTLLKSNVAPAAICAQISTAQDTGGLPNEKETKLVSSAQQCKRCKQNSALLALVSSKHDKQPQAQMQLDGMCKLVPQYSDCQLWLTHRDAILKGLSENEDMSGICSRIGQCPTMKSPQIERASIFSTGCLFCDVVAEIISSAPNTEAKLQAKRAIQAMCAILPPDARCDILASKFDDLADLLSKGSSPSSACHSVGLCLASGVEATSISMQKDFGKQTYESILNVMSEYLPSTENSDQLEDVSLVA